MIIRSVLLCISCCTYSYIYIQSFSVVKKESFKALLHYLVRSSIPHDFPSRTTVTDEIYTKSVCVKGLLAEKFRILDSRVSFTFDAGTSKAFDAYLTVTAHWIDDNWDLHDQVLAFREIVGDHSGQNTGALLIAILGEYGLVNPDRLGWGTADGSTVGPFVTRPFVSLLRVSTPPANDGFQRSGVHAVWSMPLTVHPGLLSQRLD